MVVYELHVAEFKVDFDGVTEQLDYLAGLGVNVIELMPVTEVKEGVEWGYTPLGFFAPDARFGDPEGLLRRLVNAAHGKGIAVIHDAVYAHAHPEFAYNLLYCATGETNPMMGVFDYTKPFTRDYFIAVNQFWIDQFHIDGFRYDYVPGYWDGPTGVGYAALVYQTYQASKGVPRFQPADGSTRSLIVQCAENLPDPIGILATTYSNCAWQNSFMDDAIGVATGRFPLDAFAHQLDPTFMGYPSAYANAATGETFPVAPFQYMVSHDQSRFVCRIAPARLFDLLSEPLGDRSQFYRLQPFAIALFTAKGIPMLWQGQEFAEDWSLPGYGIGRNLFPRPLHWEYFYDDWGKALVRLYRVLGSLRKNLRSLSSRGFYYYYDDASHRAQGVIAYRRQADGDGTSPAEDVLVLLNFSAYTGSVWLQFPDGGAWVEQIDNSEPNAAATINVGVGGEWHEVQVPSYYGAVYLRT
jgi:1,4-alpha-glucan branching enzyme